MASASAVLAAERERWIALALSEARDASGRLARVVADLEAGRVPSAADAAYVAGVMARAAAWIARAEQSEYAARACAAEEGR